MMTCKSTPYRSFVEGNMFRYLLLATAVLANLLFAEAFYLPGVIPHDYQDGERGKRRANLADTSAARTTQPSKLNS